MQGINSGRMNGNEVTIFDNSGRMLASWQLPTPPIFGFGFTPHISVGNFDNDSDLEIVVSSWSNNTGWDDQGNWVNENQLGVYNRDGSLVTGWPKFLPGETSSPPVVGDLDGNGAEDIVLGLNYYSSIFPDERYGGLYAFNRQGNILSGWPIEKGFEFRAAPALSDIDLDGKLEISASRYPSVTHLLRYDGSSVVGWPQYTSYTDNYGSIQGDADGDALSDVLTTAGDIYGWKSNGNTLASFPKKIESNTGAPAVLSDIDKNNKTDLIASSDFDQDWFLGEFKYRGTLYAWDLNTAYNSEKMQWPTFQHDVQRTGCYNCVTNLGEGLVAHYPFDTISQGLTPDISYYNQPATVQGAQLTTANKFPNSLVFDGVDDKVTAPHSSQVNLKGAFSVSFWFKGSKTQGPQTFVSKWTGVGGTIAWFADIAGPGGNCPSNSGVDFYVSEDGSSSDRVYVRDCNKTYQDNKLHHFAGVFEPGKSIKMYIDGQSVGTVAGTIATVNGVKQNAAPVTIGGSGSSSYYKGAMDDIRIYNRALTKQEVTALFNNSPNKLPNKLTVQPDK
jgi:hypothetical protein